MGLKFIKTTIVTLTLCLYYMFDSLRRTLLPPRYEKKKDISSQTVLVTGSANGIGRALSIHLAKFGCKLVLWDINEKGNQETAAEIKRFGGQAHPYTVDVSKRDQVYAVADKVLGEIGTVHILINNAGVVTARNFLKCPDEAVQQTLEVNTLAHFWTTKAFLPSMIEDGQGHIVGMSSSTGLFGVNGLTDYCASKFGASGFLESLSTELKYSKKNIQTTSVYPFFVNTGMVHSDQIKLTVPWIFPLLEIDYVVARMVDAIQTNQPCLYIPRGLYFLNAIQGFAPRKVNELLLEYFGISSILDESFLNRES